MAKRLENNNVKINVNIIESKVIHGFLNLYMLNSVCHRAYKEVVFSLKQVIMNMKIDSNDSI